MLLPLMAKAETFTYSDRRIGDNPTPHYEFVEKNTFSWLYPSDVVLGHGHQDRRLGEQPVKHHIRKEVLPDRMIQRVESHEKQTPTKYA